MLAFCDFVPRFEIVEKEGVFSAQVERVATFAEAVSAAGTFIREHGIKLLQGCNLR